MSFFRIAIAVLPLLLLLGLDWLWRGFNGDRTTPFDGLIDGLFRWADR